MEGLWETGLLVLPSHLDPKSTASEKEEDLGILKMSIWSFLCAVQSLHMIREKVEAGSCEYSIMSVPYPNLLCHKCEQWNQMSQMSLDSLRGAWCIGAYPIIDMSKCCTRCNNKTIISQEAQLSPIPTTILKLKCNPRAGSHPPTVWSNADFTDNVLVESCLVCKMSEISCKCQNILL